ncbi:3-hydroxyisobutyryl-CoA hydrolase [Vigna unguiculata]|uniref:3-hydroxyisobutyryl-CoA hydrolase n=1 Tax=Vigna unguiculata TaxID=3917 RepID=A0A4D6M1H0_VIGUN|nr:3-hydroxyisobutyryl-CoA hydrolase [Vigna unguiculata]
MHGQVLFTGNSCVKTVTLNRTQKLNTLSFDMANGKAFCAGGDIVSVTVCSLAGHWTTSLFFYKKLLTLEYFIATCPKPTVSLINGIVMGAGAGLSMNTNFRVVTEKTIFAMPETFIGHVPDVGASYFLSRLPGYFGEYIGLTGAKLDGAEMVACGLATHFVHSLKLNTLESVLQSVTSDVTMATLIETFTDKAVLKEDSSFKRLEVINKCFSKGTVEEIIICLEKELENGGEKWIKDALSSMSSSCPLSLKIFLKSIRLGRVQNFKQCLHRDYTIGAHMLRRTVSNDFYEGSRARLFSKDNKPKWEPSKLELVSDEMVDQCLRNVDDEDLEYLELPHHRSNSQIQSRL